jgi:hypothetical protein
VEPTRGGPTAWGLDIGLITPRREKTAWYEIFGANLGRDAKYLDGSFSRISSVPSNKFRDSRLRPLPSKPFPIHHSSFVLPFDSKMCRRFFPDRFQ